MNFVKASLLSALLFAAPVYAQTAYSGSGPKSEIGFVSENYEVSSVDANGVDMISGSVRISADLLSIGPEGQNLSYSVVTPSLAQAGSKGQWLLGGDLPHDILGQPVWKYDTYSGGIGLSGQDDCNNWFQYGGMRDDFCGSIATGLVAKNGSSATIEFVGGEYVYTTQDGTKYFAGQSNTIVNRRTTYISGINKILYPNGYEITIHRGEVNGKGIVSVLDNRGYQIRIEGLEGHSSTIKAFNMAVDYCAPLAASCSYSKAWPTASVTMGSSTQPAVATDMQGRTTKLYPIALTGDFSGMYQFNAVKPAGADEAARITYTFCGPWGEACGGNNGPVPNLGACNNFNPPPNQVCQQFRMSLNKVRTALKFGKTWQYEFIYSEY